MAEFVIQDKDLSALTSKVVIVTGGSSGIGLTTVNTLATFGAFVVNGDIRPPTQESASNVTFVKVNVATWVELAALFRKTKEIHGRIDHVFANAGINPRADYLSTEGDKNGDPKEPSTEFYDVTFHGIINTATLGIHYIRQQPEGGSIVITGPTTGMQSCRAVDYATSKHAVLGVERGLARIIEAEKLPIRVNVLVPSGKSSNLLPALKDSPGSIGMDAQSEESVARAGAMLMADTSRNGNVIHVQDGKYREIDEAVLLPAFASTLGPDRPRSGPSKDDILHRLAGPVT